MKQTVRLLCAIMIIAFSFTSCNKNNANGNVALRTEVEKINSVLPISLGLTGSFTSLEYDGNDNNVTLVMTVNPEVAPVSMLNKSEELAKSLLLQSAADPSTVKFAKTIVDAGADMKCIYRSPSGDESYTVSVTSEQIKKALEGSENMSEAEKATLALETSARMTNLSTPMSFGNGLVLENMMVEDNALVYNYFYDGDAANFELLKSNKDELADNMGSLIAGDLALLQLLDKCEKSGRSLNYRYKSSETGDNFEIVFSPDDFL